MFAKVTYLSFGPACPFPAETCCVRSDGVHLVWRSVGHGGDQKDLVSNQKSGILQTSSHCVFLMKRIVQMGHGALTGLWGAPLRTLMILAHQSDVMKMNACQSFQGAGDHEMKSVALHGHTHPEATSPPLEVHHNRDRTVCSHADSSQMNGCCCSVWNWNGASQTSQFLLGPDGRLWKPRADHSQSPCRLETAACRLREGRRQVEDQPCKRKV